MLAATLEVELSSAGLSVGKVRLCPPGEGAALSKAVVVPSRVWASPRAAESLGPDFGFLSLLCDLWASVSLM